MIRFPHSVRLRLTVWYGAVLALTLAVFSTAVYIFVLQTAQSSLDQALQNYGQQANQVAARQIHGKNLNVKKSQVSAIARKGPIAAVLYMNIHGQTKAVKKGKAAPDYPALRIALRSGHESCNTFTVVLGPASRPVPLRYCTKLIYHHGKPVAGVEVVEGLAGLEKAIDRLRIALLFGLPFSLLLAGIGGWLLAGRALEPVDHITRMARSITATDLSRRINLNRQDELGRLAGTFDEMIDRLERAFSEQRQLTADVSHELRSPLTILEAQTTLALRRSRSSDEYRQVLGSMQEEVERMSAMVNQLLTLARAEAGEEQVQLEPVSLTSVAQPLVDAIQPVADEKGVMVGLIADPTVWVMADAARLRHLVLNLLNNAVQYTPTGGRIDVTVGRSGQTPFLRVSDTGEGISPEDLPHIFRRFYRGDRARQRGTGNAGLGLAIVRWIVEAHDGDIQVQSEPGQGAAFTVTLQAAEAPAQIARVS